MKKFLKYLIPLVGALMLGGAVMVGVDTASAQEDSCTVCEDQSQRMDPPAGGDPVGPVMDFRFETQPSPESPTTYVAISPEERACVVQSVDVDLEAQISAEVEHVYNPMAPWEPAPREHTYRETGRASMVVETCVVMFGMSRVVFTGY